MRYYAFVIFSFLIFFSCDGNDKQSRESARLSKVAESYVKLVLEIGRYDPDYVDAYYGPEEWRPQPLDSIAKTQFPGDSLVSAADGIIHRLGLINDNLLTGLEKLRFDYLRKQLHSVRARARMLRGDLFSFDQESEALYDAVAPQHDASFFENLLNDLDQQLPGSGNIARRWERYRRNFIIPKERLNQVFRAAIDECRRRTLLHLELPANENFTVEYVTGKSWSAYNWYKGNSFSVIQVNTDLPVYIDRAIDLACHEGYPGHHVYSTLLEESLARTYGWVEYTVYPLFSPQSLISEGTANYGVQLTFPEAERVKFESEILFPLAGLDASKAAEYYRIFALTEQLDYAVNEAARAYLDGTMQRWEGMRWLRRYALMPVEEADKRMSFIEKYRSYVINYNLGQDIIKAYIEKHGGTRDNPDLRWVLFGKLLSVPLTPSRLK